MALDREELKRLLKEKGVKSLDDFNAFMREVNKDMVETLLEGELTDHLGFEKYSQKTKVSDNVRYVALSTILGIYLDGQKECLGLWISETESAKY